MSERLWRDSELTRSDIEERLANVPYAVADNLRNRGIDIGYNPETSTFRNWYGRTFHVDFSATRTYHTGSGKFTSNRIKINVLKGTKIAPPQLIGDTEVADVLVHEKIHHDIGIVETPLACLGLSLFCGLTRNIWATIGLTAGYIAGREFVVGGIHKLKYGGRHA